jgi:hypothetical protein
LRKFFKDFLPLAEQCTIPDCYFHKLHTTDSHVCRDCGERGHGPDTCPLNEVVEEEKTLSVECPNCKEVHDVSKEKNKLFLPIVVECPICLTDEVDIKLDCGHTFCWSCCEKMVSL